MLASCIAFILSNFDLIMFAVAGFYMVIHRLVTRGKVSEYEIGYRWLALFAVGFTGIYAAVMHIVFPDITAMSIGWQPSQFQFEVGIANLSIGLLAILSFRASYPFRLATVIASTVWLWGDASGHLYQLMQYNDLALGNAGSWFWMDVIVPALLLICIFNLKPSRAH